MIALSTISMTLIEIVSDAKASLSVLPSATPDRSSGTIVSRYPEEEGQKNGQGYRAPVT